MMCPSSIASKYLRVAWIAASQPPGVPTPSCRGKKYVAKRETPKLLAILETSLRRVKPIAMGRMPPDFLFRDISRPPKKDFETSPGQRPESVMLTKPVSAVKRSDPVSLHPTRALRC